MFEFMDTVVEAVEQFAEGIIDAAAGVTLFIIKALLVITAPLWIVPYKLWRESGGGK